MTPIPQLPYETVRARRGVCIHAAKSPAQADVYEVEWEGRRAILKDFTPRPWPFRTIWGRPVAAREARALWRVQGVRGVPRLIGFAGREALLMERLEAQRLPKQNEAPPAAFWLDARRLLNEIHAAGVAHGDLRRLNLMVGADGGACLIDFATAFSRKRSGLLCGARNFAYERCRRIDHVTLARLKSLYAPELLDEEDQLWLEAMPWYLRFGRWLKKNVIRWRKPRHWRRVLGRK